MNNLKALKTVSVISLILLALVAFALGFYPLEESARRAHIGIPVLLPVLIDLGLVLMGLGAMASRANKLPSWHLRLMTIILILVSAAVQYFHAMEQVNVQVIDVIVAVLPPIVLWASASAVEVLIFGRSVQIAVEKADAEKARAEARIKAQAERAAAKKAASPKTKATRAAPKQELKTEKPVLQEPVNAFETRIEEKKTSLEEIKTVKPASSSGGNRSINDIDEAELDDAVNRVIAGENVTAVAKELRIARSSLLNRVNRVKDA